MSDNGCTCHRCEAVYKVDLLVRDDDWRRVSGGCNLLCPACIMQSLEDIDGFGAYRLHGVDELAAKDAEIAELRQQLAEAQESFVITIQVVRGERDEARKLLGSILAYVHRDGGQYEDKHGRVTASIDAEEAISAMRVQIDEAREAAAANAACARRLYGICDNAQKFIAPFAGALPVTRRSNYARDLLAQIDGALTATPEHLR